MPHGAKELKASLEMAKARRQGLRRAGAHLPAESLDFKKQYEIAWRLLEPFGTQPRVSRIIEITGDYFAVPPRDIIANRRHVGTTWARHVAMFVAKRVTHYSLTDIGRFCGKRDHSTVISAVKRMERCYDVDKELRAAVDHIERKVLQ